MKDEFLLVKKSTLPDIFDKVLKARRLIESGATTDVSAAVRQLGISRSTYYKYKDCVFSPDNGGNQRKAVLSLLLSHEIGILSKVLNRLSQMGASVLTISQTMPIHDIASVIIAIDISNMEHSVDESITDLRTLSGVESASLVLIE